jgi:hypothetical protein
MIKELICKVFYTRNAAHLAHWKTSSYAHHVALGDFYEEIVDGLDKLVEAYQGTFGKIEGVDDYYQDACKDITDHISEDLIWMNDNCDDITKDIASLDNILQELQAVYMKTIYKLENLS